MKLIAGLGNPGNDYANHKHNIGFWVLDALAKLKRVKWESFSNLALVSWTEIEGEECWLVKPLTWMNVSGKALSVLLKDKQIEPKDLLVVHDDLDIGLGKLRWSFGSGFGGHNGAQSIIESLGTKDFSRLRLGVGRPPAHKDAADYVLQPFVGEALVLAEELTERALHSIKDFMKHGLAWVQNHYHS